MNGGTSPLGFTSRAPNVNRREPVPILNAPDAVFDPASDPYLTTHFGPDDTVQHLDAAANTGNGFLFRHFDASGLHWAVGQALRFHAQPAAERAKQLSRVMRESAARFNHQQTAADYIKRYEQMLGRPLTE